MTKSPRKNVPNLGIELGATCMPSELASDRATAPGCYITVRKGVDCLLSRTSPREKESVDCLLSRTSPRAVLQSIIKHIIAIKGESRWSIVKNIILRKGENRLSIVKNITARKGESIVYCQEHHCEKRSRWSIVKNITARKGENRLSIVKNIIARKGVDGLLSRTSPREKERVDIL